MMENNQDFKIIVIDDNPNIHDDFIKILSKPVSSHLDELSIKMFGKKSETEMSSLPQFKIDTASQGQEGVEVIKKAFEEKSPYSLAFVDIRMPPGWDGIETIKHIWEIDKDIQIVICTAYSDYSWEETVAHLGKTDNLLILKKPFDNISVRQLACALTKKWQLLQDSKKFTESLKEQIHNRTNSLEKSLSLIKATLESSNEGIIVINNQGEIIDYNQKFCTLWNVPDDIINTNSKKIIQDFMKNQLESPDIFIQWMENIQDTEDTVSIDEIKLKNGRILDCYSRAQRLNEKIVGRVLNFEDITERILLERNLQHQAKHDALTDLPNRVLLLEHLHEALKISQKNHSIFAVLFLDLDRFKLINDSLSHDTGDELLSLVAKRLKPIIEKKDTLARLGGDEFIILLANLSDREEIIKKAKTILQLFQTPFLIHGRSIYITASIGISIFPEDGTSGDILLRNADAAMYHVKELGSNNFHFYTKEMNEKSLEKLDKETQLRNALANNELYLCYQPQFDLSNEQMIAAEALLRWKCPNKGVLLPLDFVPLAEETGLIVPIGEWTIRTACLQNKKWQESGYPPIRIAVNVTAEQIKQQNFVEMIKSILTETKLKPEYLELELTENIIISSAEIIRKVNDLKKLGIVIAIDDFGTGYSSLSYLKKLPIDRLKIDGSFIQHIKDKKDDEVIIRAIIAVAKNLNLEVLAEGVETQNQLNFLKKQNCNEIQGFYYSKPLSVQEVETIFNKANKKETNTKE